MGQQQQQQSGSLAPPATTGISPAANAAQAAGTTAPGLFGGPGGNVIGGRTGQPVGLQLAPYAQVAPFTNQQLAGLQLTSDVSQPAQQALGNALNTNNFFTSGALMNPNANPYLRGMYDAAAQGLTQQYETAVAPNILQQAAQTGTLGSQGMAQGFQDAQSSLGLSLSDLANQMFGGAYNTGLQATQNAIAGTPGLAQGQYIPANQLLNVGNIGQKQMQDIMNTATQNLTGQSNFITQGLGGLANLLGSLGGSQSTSIGTGLGAGPGKG